jgi:hypothetical protein
MLSCGEDADEAHGGCVEPSNEYFVYIKWEMEVSLIWHQLCIYLLFQNFFEPSSWIYWNAVYGMLYPFHLVFAQFEFWMDG